MGATNRSPWHTQGDESRERIHWRARSSSLSVSGYHGTSIAAVASGRDCRPISIYWHFRQQETICVAAVIRRELRHVGVGAAAVSNVAVERPV